MRAARPSYVGAAVLVAAAARAVSAECDDRPVCDIFQCRSGKKNCDRGSDNWNLDLPQSAAKLPCPARWAPMQGTWDEVAKTGPIGQL